MKNYEAIKLKNIIKIKEFAMTIQVAETDRLRKENLILRAQLTPQYKDAYNKAIDDAYENAAIHQKYYNEYDHKTMYMRWKDKGYPRVDGDGYQYGVDVISIDKQSILKLKIK